MSAPCYHPTTQPVEVEVSPGQVEVVAHACLTCDETLPPSWGCRECQWVEQPRKLCDPYPGQLRLGMPCRKHASA